MTVDSSASQSMRLPAVGIPGSAPVSAQPEAMQRTPHPSLPPVVSEAAAGPPSTVPPASAPVQAKPAPSGFLVQQPSSKLWMEAVPMRYSLPLHDELSACPCLCPAVVWVFMLGLAEMQLRKDAIACKRHDCAERPAPNICWVSRPMCASAPCPVQDWHQGDKDVPSVQQRLHGGPAAG